MERALPVLQIIIAVLLIVTVLLQQRGTGLSVTFGGMGGGEFYRSRRGIEKFLFAATIVLATLIVVLSVLSAVI